MSSGDVRIKITGEQDVAPAFNAIVTSLEKLNKQFRKTTRQLTKSDKKFDAISKSVQDMAKNMGNSKRSAEGFEKELVDTGKAANTASKKLDKAKKKIKDVGTSSKKSEKQVKGFGSLLGITGKKAGSLGEKIEFLVGNLMALSGVVVGMLLPIREWAKFEQKMAEVQGITNATSAELKEMSEVARYMGKQTVHSAVNAADGLKYLAMAGLSVEEAITALPTALNLATAGMMSLGESADIVTNVMTGMGLAADDLERVGDVLGKTFTSSNVNLSELGVSMAYVAPLTAALGVEIEETAALIGMLGNAGIKGCYDRETDVLTLDGWKKWEEVTDTDIFATRNPDTGELEYQTPERLIRYKHTGKMYKVCNKGIDLCVTPEHRMWAKENKNFNITRAKDIKKHNLIYEGFNQDSNSLYETGRIKENETSWVDYDDEVFCAEVPNGLLIVRRNGRAIVSGNSRGGTVLRASLARLAEAPPKAQKALDRLGQSIGQSTINITDAAGEFLGMTEILKQFEKAGLTTADAVTIFGRRAGPGMVSLVSQGSEALEEFIKKNEESAGAMEKLARIQRDTVAGSFKIAVSAMKEAAITIGKSLNPAVREVLDMAKDLATDFGNWVQENKTLASSLIKLAALMAVVLGAVTGMGIALRVAGAAMTGFHTAATQLIMVLKLMWHPWNALKVAGAGVLKVWGFLAVHPIGLAIGAVTLAVVGAIAAYKYFTKTSEELREEHRKQVEALKDTAEAFHVAGLEMEKFYKRLAEAKGKDEFIGVLKEMKAKIAEVRAEAEKNNLGFLVEAADKAAESIDVTTGRIKDNGKALQEYGFARLIGEYKLLITSIAAGEKDLLDIENNKAKRIAFEEVSIERRKKAHAEMLRGNMQSEEETNTRFEKMSADAVVRYKKDLDNYAKQEEDIRTERVEGAKKLFSDMEKYGQIDFASQSSSEILQYIMSLGLLKDASIETYRTMIKAAKEMDEATTERLKQSALQELIKFGDAQQVKRDSEDTSKAYKEGLDQITKHIDSFGNELEAKDIYGEIFTDDPGQSGQGVIDNFKEFYGELDTIGQKFFLAEHKDYKDFMMATREIFANGEMEITKARKLEALKRQELFIGMEQKLQVQLANLYQSVYKDRIAEADAILARELQAIKLGDKEKLQAIRNSYKGRADVLKEGTKQEKAIIEKASEQVWKTKEGHYTNLANLIREENGEVTAELAIEYAKRRNITDLYNDEEIQAVEDLKTERTNLIREGMQEDLSLEQQRQQGLEQVREQARDTWVQNEEGVWERLSDVLRANGEDITTRSVDMYLATQEAAKQRYVKEREFAKVAAKEIVSTEEQKQRDIFVSEQRNLHSKKQIIEQGIRTATDGASGLKEDLKKIEKEITKSTQDETNRRYGYYKKLIDKSIQEEERLAQKVKDLQKERVNLANSYEDQVRDIKREGMSKEEKQVDMQQEINENIQKAIQYESEYVQAMNRAAQTKGKEQEAYLATAARKKELQEGEISRAASLNSSTDDYTKKLSNANALYKTADAFKETQIDATKKLIALEDDKQEGLAEKLDGLAESVQAISDGIGEMDFTVKFNPETKTKIEGVKKQLLDVNEILKLISRRIDIHISDKELKDLKQEVKNFTTYLTDPETLKLLLGTEQWDKDLASTKAAFKIYIKELNDMAKVNIKTTENDSVGGPAGWSMGIGGAKTGARLPGYGGGDKIRALLEPGEWVIRKEAVRKYGDSLMSSLNSMRLPKFNLGGSVGAVASGAKSAINTLQNFGRVQLDMGNTQIPAIVHKDVMAEINSQLYKQQRFGT